MTLVGGMLLAGRLTRTSPPSKESLEKSPMTDERREKLAVLQDIVLHLRNLARAGQWERVAVLAEREQDRSSMIRSLKAEALARLGKHDQAAAVLANIYRGQDEPSLLAVTQPKTAYARMVTKSLNEVATGKESPGFGVRTAWIVTLLPAQPAVLESAVRLAERGLAVSATPSPQEQMAGRLLMLGPGPRAPDRADTLQVLGVALLRQGKLDEALVRLRESESLRPTPHIWAYLTLALRLQKKDAEAQVWERQFFEYMDRTFGGQTRAPQYFLHLRELDTRASHT
jgi:tetratricopeptide (TPR) repeat protein